MRKLSTFTTKSKLMKFWLGIFFEMRILLPSYNWIDNLIYMPPIPPFVLIQSRTGGIHAEVDHLLQKIHFFQIRGYKDTFT